MAPPRNWLKALVTPMAAFTTWFRTPPVFELESSPIPSEDPPKLNPVNNGGGYVELGFHVGAAGLGLVVVLLVIVWGWGVVDDLDSIFLSRPWNKKSFLNTNFKLFILFYLSVS